MPSCHAQSTFTAPSRLDRILHLSAQHGLKTVHPRRTSSFYPVVQALLWCDERCLSLPADPSHIVSPLSTLRPSKTCKRRRRSYPLPTEAASLCLRPVTYKSIVPLSQTIVLLALGLPVLTLQRACTRVVALASACAQRSVPATIQ